MFVDSSGFLASVLTNKALQVTCHFLFEVEYLLFGRPIVMSVVVWKLS